MIVNLHNKGGEHIASWRLPDAPPLPPGNPYSYAGPKLLFWPTDSISERRPGFDGRFFMLDTSSIPPHIPNPQPPAYRECDPPYVIGELPK